MTDTVELACFPPNDGFSIRTRFCVRPTDDPCWAGRPNRKLAAEGTRVDEWSDWKSGDFLYATDKPGAEVPLAEVLHRVSVGFRRVVIDWTEGDRWVDWRLAKHTEVGSPPVIMDAEHSLRGRTALVSLSEEVGPDAVWVRFFLIKHDTASLDLNYQPATAAERGRALAYAGGTSWLSIRQR